MEVLPTACAASHHTGEQATQGLPEVVRDTTENKTGHRDLRKKKKKEKNLKV